MSTLWTQLGLNISQFMGGLEKAKHAAAHAGKEMNEAFEFSKVKNRIAELFTVGALGEMAHKVIEFGASIQDLSNKMGVSTDTVQIWKFAAEQTGAEIGDFETSYKKLTRSIQASLDDDIGPAADAFHKLGISVETVKTMTQADLFNVLLGKMGEAKVSGKELAAIMTLLGKNALNLRGAASEGMGHFAEELKHIHGLLDKGEIADAKHLADSLGKLKTTALATGGRILDFEHIVHSDEFKNRKGATWWSNLFPTAAAVEKFKAERDSHETPEQTERREGKEAFEKNKALLEGTEETLSKQQQIKKATSEYDLKAYKLAASQLSISEQTNALLKEREALLAKKFKDPLEAIKRDEDVLGLNEKLFGLNKGKEIGLSLTSREKMGAFAGVPLGNTSPNAKVESILQESLKVLKDIAKPSMNVSEKINAIEGISLLRFP